MQAQKIFLKITLNAKEKLTHLRQVGSNNKGKEKGQYDYRGKASWCTGQQVLQQVLVTYFVWLLLKDSITISLSFMFLI